MASTTRSVSVPFTQLGESRHIVADARGSFGGLHEDGFHVRRQQSLDFLDRKGLAVGLGEHNRIGNGRPGRLKPSARPNFPALSTRTLIARAGQVAD